MKKILVLLLLFLPAIALALPTSTTSTVTLTTLMEEGSGVWSSWASLSPEAIIAGAISALIATVNFLTNISKWGPIGAWIKRRKLKWLRPLMALILGTLISVSAALAAGQSLALAILLGLIGGFGSAGFHQLWTIFEQRGKLEE